MKIKLILVLLFCLLEITTSVNAQINIDKLNNKFNLTPHAQIYGGAQPPSSDTHPVFSDLWEDSNSKGLSRGPTEEASWYRLMLKSNKEVQKVLYFNYTLIPNLEIWVFSSEGDSLHYFGGTGSPARLQSLGISEKGYSYIIDFKKGEEKTIYFRMDGQGWPIHSEVFLFDVPSFLESNQNEFYIISFLRAVVITLLSIGFFIGILSRQPVFLLYALTFGIGIFFAECEIGLFIDLFGAEYHDANYIMRHFFNLVYIISLVYFYNLFIPEERFFKKFLSWFSPSFLIYSVISVITLVASSSPVVVYVNFIAIVIISWVSFFVSSVILYKNRNHSILSKYLFVVQMSRLVIIAMFVTLPHMGVIQRASYTDYVYYIFIVYESVVYFYLLLKRSITIYNEKIELKKAMLEKHKLYSKAVLEGQEKERNRIGRELHDSIGGNLALFNKSDSNMSQEAKNILTDTMDSIRNLSHELISPSFHHISFRESIIDLVSKYNSERQKVVVQFHDWPEITNKETKHHCFRIIQELIHNASKHSQAETVFIQFFGNDDGIGNIYYEDNGVGFDTNNVRGGIGLNNIDFRSASIGAKLTIESSVKGTIVKIEHIDLHKEEAH
ncbi:7TM-DISM domain-containing protein [Flammeovirga sp. SJP92]|uniref:sensor histidine kinase n=1 Tax=Flammeovirga sp. SJP92 TaxID=1775430 RepID=UPI0007895196|nr:7TM-DISM domain-containing protein [Flammeovirga sp. SJP92]KXX70210.1 hypothetical protein AVL50_15205 [Flammeovirga sp. SJP92]